LCNKLVNLSQVISLSNVAKGSVASFSDIEVLLFNGKLSKSLPVCLNFRGHIERFKDLNSLFQTLVFKSSSEFNQGLSQLIRDSVLAEIHNHLSLSFCPLDALDVALDLVHGYLIRLIDRVPNAEVITILGDNHIGVWDPANILAIVQEGLLLLLFDIVEVKLAALVSEEKLGAAWVQLKIVNLAIMGDVGQHGVGSQVLDAKSQGV